MNAEIRVDPHVTDVSQDPVTVPEIKRFHDHDGDDSGSGVTVVVMDSGIDTTHDVFSDVAVRAPDPNGMGTGDDVGHGTAVAGLIAQLAPTVEEIIDLRIFGSSGQTGFAEIKTAYNWLFDHTDEIDVVNMSWGARQRVPELDNRQNKLIDKGVQDVTAAGNTGDRGGSPATAKKAFGIGACTIDGTLTRFSSYNPDRDNPDVTALGKNIKLPRASGTSMGSVINENWTMASGTSFSAPITAGYVARYLSEGLSKTVTRFESTARDITGTPEDGEGILDYQQALNEPSQPSPPDPSTTARVFTVPWSQDDLIHVDGNVLDEGEYTISQQELAEVFGN